ncbi:MAG: periplasmic heavy metal sensor [Bacteroidales bacterium]|nr:periplasmic heavy metal sensor [Bacteroidales bacterium]
MTNTRVSSWLKWTIILLAVANISTWVTILYIHYYKNSDLVKNTQQPTNNTVDLSGRYFREQLNWDDNQMEKFRQIHPLFRQEVRYIITKISSTKQDMLNEMFNVSPDTARLDALSDSIGYWHGRLKKITYRYFLELKRISSLEQQKQLEQIFSQLMIGDVPMVGKGWGHRKRHMQPSN